ncbi:ABC transporter substrate binding protein [Arenibaculum pallidiluteum]|uniref:ABC transporter substrate binding protein n=1 Tax=Arenibaculum pallidiluteum TaxID=2812559 RepID=UPI001A9784BE|nr:ABC transporter substrate binding protein [Arenibaculum pallidiluteum]
MRVLTLLAAILVLATGAAQAQTAGRQRPFIYLINWRGCEQVCAGFQQYFSDRKIGVDIVMRDANQSRSAVAEFVKEARLLRPDVVVTWGNDVTLEAVGRYDSVDPEKHLTDLPVVYMYVAGAAEAKISRSEDRTGRPNLLGTDYVVPLEAQVNAMRTYRPLRRLGMLYDTTQPASVLRMQQMKALSTELGYELIALSIPVGKDGKPDPASLPALTQELRSAEVDFVYFGLSTFLIQRMKQFTALAVEEHLPVFTGGPLPLLQADALLALYVRLDQIGALAGSQVDRILRDPNLRLDTAPIEKTNRFSLAVNIRVAKRLDAPPPVTIARIAEIIQ